jgi:outer membrane protein TolC
MMRLLPLLVFGALLSCTGGSRQAPPADNLPAAWKNAGFPEPLPAGDWFRLFHDPALAALLRGAEKHNQDLQAALARYDQARAALGLARADQAPSLTADLTAERKQESGSSSFQAKEGAYHEYNAQLNLAYEIDLWGRLRSLTRQAADRMEAMNARRKAYSRPRWR